LGAEKKKFDVVDRNWRSVMEVFKRENLLYDAIESDKIKVEFENSNRMLEQIQKSLSEYLESKRKHFPRFYFLSDEELLEILA
jgi:dynein heavy chain